MYSPLTYMYIAKHRREKEFRLPDLSLPNMVMIFIRTLQINNTNKRDVQRKNVVNNIDSWSLRAPCQNGPYTEKHTEQYKTT